MNELHKELFGEDAEALGPFFGDRKVTTGEPPQGRPVERKRFDIVGRLVYVKDFCSILLEIAIDIIKGFGKGG